MSKQRSAPRSDSLEVLLRPREPLACAAGRCRPAAPSRLPSSRTSGSPPRLPLLSDELTGRARPTLLGRRHRLVLEHGRERDRHVHRRRAAAPARRGARTRPRRRPRRARPRRRSSGGPRRSRSRGPSCAPTRRASRGRAARSCAGRRPRRRRPRSSSSSAAVERDVHHRARRDQRHVVALALDVGDAERDEVARPSGTGPLVVYIILSSNTIAGLSSRIAAFISPFASCRRRRQADLQARARARPRRAGSASAARRSGASRRASSGSSAAPSALPPDM